MNPYYHAATGHTNEIVQEDGHAPMIGYALDGFGIFALFDKDGNEPEDLDECRWHFDKSRRYHYRAEKPGEDEFIGSFCGTPGSIRIAR